MDDAQYLDPTKLNSSQLRSVLSKYGVVLNTTAQNKTFLVQQYKQHDIARKIKERQAGDITRKKRPHKRTIEMVDGDRVSPKPKRRKSSVVSYAEEKKVNLADLMQHIPNTAPEDTNAVKSVRSSPFPSSTRSSTTKKEKKRTSPTPSPLQSLIPSLHAEETSQRKSPRYTQPKVVPEFPPSPKKGKRRSKSPRVAKSSTAASPIKLEGIVNEEEKVRYAPPSRAPKVTAEFPPSPKKTKKSKSPRVAAPSAVASPIRFQEEIYYDDEENDFQPSVPVQEEPIHIHVPQYVVSKPMGQPRRAVVPRRRKSKSPRSTKKRRRTNEEFYDSENLSDSEDDDEDAGNRRAFFFLLLKLLSVLCILAILFYGAFSIANYQPILPYCEAGALEKANVCKKCPTNGICTAGTHRCNCPMGYIVSNDGSNCIPDESIPLLADKLTTQYLQPLLRKHKGEYECNHAYSPELSKDEVDSLLRETYKSLAPGDPMMNDYLLAYRHILSTLDSHQIYRIVDHRTEKVMLGTHKPSLLTLSCHLYLTWKDWKYLIILLLFVVPFLNALFFIGRLQKKVLRKICYQLEDQAESTPDSPGISKVVLRDTYCHHSSKYSINYYVWQKILKEVAHDNRIKETTQLLDGAQTIMWESGVSA